MSSCGKRLQDREGRPVPTCGEASCCGGSLARADAIGDVEEATLWDMV